MAPMPTERDARRIAQLVVEAVDPIRVVLFGSLARGEERPGDIDLMVVMPDGTDRLATAKALHRIVGRQTDVDADVDFVIVTPSVLQQYRNSVIANYSAILAEGQELYAAA